MARKISANKTTARKTLTGKTLKRAAGLAAFSALAMLITACSGNQAAKPDEGPRPGPPKKYDPEGPSIFGEGGLSLGNIGSGSGAIFGGGGDEKARLPVNKYLWQGALDTLSFLPLASTDPFSGVIATEWGSTPDAPNDRFKVTAYILSPGLSAASLKVAVFREILSESELWIPAPVSADTAVKLEDAILDRARQIRIAEIDDGATG